MLMAWLTIRIAGIKSTFIAQNTFSAEALSLLAENFSIFDAKRECVGLGFFWKSFAVSIWAESVLNVIGDCESGK